MFRMKNGFLTIEKEGKVADISGGVDAENRNILVWNKHGKINQQWDIVYVEDWNEPKKGELNKDFGFYVERDFHLESKLGSNRYLDILGRNLVIKTPNGRKSQIFYFHQLSRTIRTRTNNQSFDIQSSGKNKNMQVWSTNSSWW